jgi:AI-2 transport protein TqsA
LWGPSFFQAQKREEIALVNESIVDGIEPGEGPSPSSPLFTETRFGHRLMITATSVLLVALLVYLLKEFALVLQQLLVAVFLAYLIVPVHNWLVRRGVSPPLGYAVIAIAILLAAYALGQIIYRSVEHLTANLPVYRDNLNRTIQNLIQQTPGVDRRQLERFIKGESDFFDTGMKTLASVAGTFFSFLSQMIVILVYLAFLLAEESGFSRRIRAAFKPDSASYILAIIERINFAIGRYVALKTLINLAVGVLTTVALSLFRVDYALLWGILAFLFNYIPYLGSVIAIIPPVLLSLVQFESLGWSAVVLTTLLVIHNGIAYFVEPRLTGDRLDLSPIVILLALAFWASIWGTVGMVLAIPLTVVIKTILENIPETRPLARMLSSE